MPAYYNENDPFAAAWLRELIKRDLIAKGDVDDRSITDVQSSDLQGYNQCHFFAGIGGWSYALRLGGWPDDRPVWTGSCPCQPFSAAGQRRGFDDSRHLWPVWIRLIRESKPPVIFGEQVAGAPVTGKIIQDADMYQVLGRKACFDVLLQSQRLLQEGVPGVREQEAQRMSPCWICGRPNPGTRQNTDSSGTLSREQNEPAVQSGCGEHPSTHHGGILRTDGSGVRLDDSEGVEFAITGPYNSKLGLYDGQRAGGHICRECHGAQLGSELDSEDSGANQESAQERLKRLVSEAGRGFETSPSTWLSFVQSDLEGSGYSFGACTLAAASVGAPHQRQRIYWVADASSHRARNNQSVQEWGSAIQSEACRVESDVADAAESRRPRAGQHDGRPSQLPARLAEYGSLVIPALEQVGIPRRARESGGAVALSNGGHSSPKREQRSGEYGQQSTDSGIGELGHSRHWDGSTWASRTEYEPKSSIQSRLAGTSPWTVCDWLPCIDGRARPVEPGTFPLAHGLPARVGRLRGYGNAIVPQVASQFVGAYMDLIARPVPSGTDATKLKEKQ